MSLITVATDAINSELTGKPFFESKTFWTNMVAIAGIGFQMKYGFVISPDLQALALSLINLVLRSITKEPIVLS